MASPPSLTDELLKASAQGRKPVDARSRPLSPHDRRFIKALNLGQLTDKTKQRLWDSRRDDAQFRKALEPLRSFFPGSSLADLWENRQAKDYGPIAGAVLGTERTGLPVAGGAPVQSPETYEFGVLDRLKSAATGTFLHEGTPALTPRADSAQPIPGTEKTGLPGGAGRPPQVIDPLDPRGFYHAQPAGETFAHLGKGVVSGLSSLTAGLGGGGAQWLGGLMDSNLLRSAGKSVSDVNQTVQQWAALPPELQASPLDDPSVMGDARWWSHLIGSGAGSMIPLLLAGVGVAATGLTGAAARWGPAGVTAILEGVSEGSNAYDAAIRRGADESTAARVATETAALTAGTSVVALRTGIFNEQLRGGARVGASAALETGQEALQEFGGNVAFRRVDPTQPLHEGVIEGGLMGGILGGGAGLVLGGGRAAVEPLPAESAQAVTPEVVDPSAELQTLTPLEQAVSRGTPALDTTQAEPIDITFTGEGPLQLERGLKMPAVEGAATPSGPSIEVAEGEVTTIPPSSRDVAKPNEYRPRQIGKSSWVKAGDQRILTNFAVVSNGEIVISHSSNLVENENFPQYLQNRQRESKLSDQQINEIHNKLDPEQLGESYIAGNGAPIVGPDMIVEVGNGRSLALRRGYDQDTAPVQRYKKWLVRNAERFGLDADQISALDDPQLVRVRPEGIPIDRQQFVEDANAPGAAVLGPTEIAMQDSSRLTGTLLGGLNPEAALNSAENRRFIRGFVETVVSPSERAQVMTGEGEISSVGLARVQNAIFAKAYGDPVALERMAESSSDTNRALTQALVGAAPKMVTTQEQIASGDLHDVPIHRDAARAAGLIAELRRKNLPLTDYLNQKTLIATTDDLTPTQKKLARFMDANAGAARKVQALLDNYNTALEAAGNPKQEVIFGAATAPSQGSLLATALEQTNKQYPGKKAGRRVKGGEISKQLRPMSEVDIETAAGVAEGVDAIYKPPKRGRKRGILWLNEAGMTILEGVAEVEGLESVIGLSIPTRFDETILSNLRKLAQRAGEAYGSKAQENLELFTAQVSQALATDEASVVAVTATDKVPLRELKGTVRHERFHAGSEELRESLDQVRLIEPTVFLANEAAGRAAKRLMEMGYPANGEILAEEIGARVIGGGPTQWAELRISNTDAESIALAYWRELQRNVGEDAIDFADAIAPQMRGVLDARTETDAQRSIPAETRDEFSGAAEPAEIGGRGQEGRGGGVLEGIPAPLQPSRTIQELLADESGQLGGDAIRGQIRAQFRRRVNEGLPAIDPKVEAALTRRAKQDAGFTRLRDFFADRWIPEWRVRGFPDLVNRLRLVKDAGLDANRAATADITKVVASLSFEEYSNFRRQVMLERWEYLLSQGKEIPENLTAEDVQKALGELRDSANDAVRGSLERHREMTTRMGLEMARRGKISEDAARAPFFHHEVIQYSESLEDRAWMPRRLKTPSRRYSRQRGSTLPVESDYINVTHRHLARVYMDNGIDDFIDETARDYDETPSLDPETKREIFRNKIGQPRDGGIYTMPDGRVLIGWQPDSGRFFQQVNVIPDGALKKAIEAAPEGGPLAIDPNKISKKTAIGGRKPTYLLEPAIVSRLQRFRQNRQQSILYDSTRWLNSTWKRSVLFFAGIPHQFTNLVPGDLQNLYRVNLRAFTKLPDAMRMVWYEDPGGDLSRFKDLAFEQRITETSTFMGGEVVGLPSSPERNPKLAHLLRPEMTILDLAGRAIAAPFRFYETISTGREAIPRLAHFISNMERIENYARESQRLEKETAAANDPNRRAKLRKNLEKLKKTAPDVVRTHVNVQGLRLIEAAGKAARADLVDYGSSTPEFDVEMRGFWFPFIQFYAQNAKNWARSTRHYPGEMFVKFGLPTLALWAWNNSDDRAEIEKRLPEFERTRTHIVLGEWAKTADGEYVILSWETAQDVARRVFGLDTLEMRLRELVDGDKSPQEVGEQLIEDITHRPFENAYELLNPFIKSLLDINANKSSFTKRQIVPARLMVGGEATEEGRRMQLEYLVGQMISPYGAFQRAARDTDPGDDFVKWLTKGPLDIQRAVGIRERDLYAADRFRTFEQQTKVKGAYEDTMARLERAYITRRVSGDLRGFISEDFERINEASTAPVPPAAWITRSKSTGLRIRLAREQLGSATTDRDRTKFEKRLELLQDKQLRESRKRMPRPTKRLLEPLPRR